jgi:hypothetical protein
MRDASLPRIDLHQMTDMPPIHIEIGQNMENWKEIADEPG